MNKQYDLEERSYQFTKEVRLFIKILEKTIANIEDSRQIVRSSGSVRANYIEANESLSKKDIFLELKYIEKKQKKVFLVKVNKDTKQLSKRDSKKINSRVNRIEKDILSRNWKI